MSFPHLMFRLTLELIRQEVGLFSYAIRNIMRTAMQRLSPVHDAEARCTYYVGALISVYLRINRLVLRLCPPGQGRGATSTFEPITLFY